MAEWNEYRGDGFIISWGGHFPPEDELDPQMNSMRPAVPKELPATEIPAETIAAVGRRLAEIQNEDLTERLLDVCSHPHWHHEKCILGAAKFYCFRCRRLFILKRIGEDRP